MFLFSKQQVKYEIILLGTLFDTVCVTQAVQPNLSPGWSGDLKGIILNFKLISIEHSSACKAEGVVPIFQNVPLSLCNNCMCIWNFGIFFFKNRMALFPLQGLKNINVLRVLSHNFLLKKKVKNLSIFVKKNVKNFSIFVKKKVKNFSIFVKCEEKSEEFIHFCEEKSEEFFHFCEEKSEEFFHFCEM